MGARFRVWQSQSSSGTCRGGLDIEPTDSHDCQPASVGVRFWVYCWITIIFQCLQELNFESTDGYNCLPAPAEELDLESTEDHNRLPTSAGVRFWVYYRIKFVFQCLQRLDFFSLLTITIVFRLPREFNFIDFILAPCLKLIRPREFYIS